MGIHVIPVLDEILFEFFPYIYMWGCWYQPSHDPVFHTSFPFSYCCTLYKGEGVCNFSIGVIHEWGIQIEELVKFEFMHKLVGFCSVAREDRRFFSF